jgi:hypothetical protein
MHRRKKKAAFNDTFASKRRTFGFNGIKGKMKRSIEFH